MEKNILLILIIVEWLYKMLTSEKLDEGHIVDVVFLQRFFTSMGLFQIEEIKSKNN